MEIGSYKIEQVDEDHFLVTDTGLHVTQRARITGGDFETLLSALFINPEFSTEFKHNVVDKDN